ncbi:MAG: corrinoid protein [Actinomycetota bacterium]|nr:corrinoid protein [Actinomycetota bacterium]MDD5665699.1 corrinoid protein [Actinomycetota bacterium]
MQDILDGIRQAILAGEEEDARRLVGDGLEKGLEPRRIMEGAMMPAMEDIGERFSRGEAFIPELIVAAEAMQRGMEVLKPHLGGPERGSGLVLLGTVHGDIHSIGKNLVRMCLEGTGFEVVDVGEDVKTERFVEAYREHRPDILGLSALLSSTMQRIPEVVEAVRAEDKAAVIMVGGAPVTQEFADQSGADGYAPNAFEAAKKARELLG